MYMHLCVYRESKMKSAYKQSNGAKKGFTLVELLVVIAIMGILAGMSFAGFQGAVRNNRVKDAAVNLAAFMERVAAKASSMSETLCIKATDARTIKVYSGCAVKEGEEGEGGTKGDDELVTGDNNIVDSFTLEPTMTLVTNSTACADLCNDNDKTCSNWLVVGKGSFAPKLGLSAMPASGYVCAAYSDGTSYAGASKSKDDNNIGKWIMIEGSNWEEY